MNRLMHPEDARSAWTIPDLSASLGDRGTAIRDAFVTNGQSSHGAIGAIQLYYDVKADCDLHAPATRDVLIQSMLLAASAMPFHDYSFRRDLREAGLECEIRTDTMAIAALLAFVDSIQDDRRDLGDTWRSDVILVGWEISQDAAVKATVNFGALSSTDVLNKRIEALDVTAALSARDGGIQCHYPAWMV